MNQELQDYGMLLRAFVQGQQVEPEGEIDWNAVMRMAQINNTVGILGYLLMTNPGLAPRELTAFGRQQCLREIAVFSSRAEQMKLLIARMNERGIDHLLFKGYLVRELYPVPELRSFGDIDFVIRKEDREKCDSMMLELGFRREADWEPVYSYQKGVEYYEIHTEVLEVDVSDKADYRGYYSHIWEHAVNTEGHTYVFTPEYHLLYLLTHIAKHLSGSGAGIRMYMDIALYVNHYRDTLDWSYVNEQLGILKFERFANMVFTAVERWFGVESPIALTPISDEVLEDFLAFTLEGGVFGKVGRESGEIYLKKATDEAGGFSRWRVLLRRLFPPASVIEPRYTYLQGRHWLLPFAWIHRLIRTSGKLRSHAHEAGTIMSAEEEKVLKLARMHREIGL